MKRYLITVIVIASGLVTAFTFEDDAVARIVGALQKFSDSYPQEKVFIHTDKPYYSVGDTIWYKGYLVDGRQNQPSALSKVLYVDLVDDKDSVVSAQKVKMTVGLGNASIVLPINLAPGNYTLYGYTGWMRNFDQDFFFSQKISVVNPFADTKPLKPAATTAIEFKLFPEGGDLVEGIKSIVAFKAITDMGNGVPVSGYVSDQHGIKVAEFSSEHLGMGAFSLLPEPGMQYTAVLTNGNKVPFPAAKMQGATLSANNSDTSKLGVKVVVSQALANKELVLVLQQNGLVKYAAKVKTARVTNVNVQKNRLQTGLVQVTLFDGLTPLAERLVFIDRADALNVKLTTTKRLYTPREKVDLKLNVNSGTGVPLMTSFSVAVVDEGKVNSDEKLENNILSSLLLTSDVKGLIEQPGYYFNSSNASAPKHLDLLMLTQGWRRFTWKSLLSNVYPAIAFQPEKALVISGRITTEGNKPHANAKAVLMASAGGIFSADTLTNAAGEFAFDNMSFPDSLMFLIQGSNQKGSKFVKTIFNQETQVRYRRAISIAANFDLQAYMDASRKKYAGMFEANEKNAILIREVEITAVKAPIIPNSSNLNGPGKADQVITADMLENEFSLFDYIRSHVPGTEIVDGILRLRRNAMSEAPVQFVVDGSYVDQEFASFMNVSDIAGVEILKSGGRSGIYGLKGGGGVIVVTSKTREERKGNSYKPGLSTIRPKGYALEREFYAPVYTQTLPGSPPDLRSTIYWNANLVTSKSGEASASFYNADAPGTYKVIVQGIYANGSLGYAVHRYQVK